MFTLKNLACKGLSIILTSPQYPGTMRVQEMVPVFGIHQLYPQNDDAAKEITHHDDIMTRTHFPHYWPFVQGIRSLVDSPDRGLVMWFFDIFHDVSHYKLLNKQSNYEDLRHRTGHVTSLWCTLTPL